jgi:hypothetical protein
MGLFFSLFVDLDVCRNFGPLAIIFCYKVVYIQLTFGLFKSNV